MPDPTVHPLLAHIRAEHLPHAEVASDDLLDFAHQAAHIREGTPCHDVAAIICPRCGAASHHPEDRANGYCGQCQWWTSDPVLGQVEPPRERPSDTGPVATVPHLTGEELDVLRIELDVAMQRWSMTLAGASAPEVQQVILRRLNVIRALRTAFEEARASMVHRQVLGSRPS